jgi:dephospho-CoA kinase
MKRPFVLGLTGSIGMGKSTVAGFFRDEDIAVWDADETVHRLYAKGGSAARRIVAFRPHAVIDGAVSREALKEWIKEDPTALRTIEELVHPLVASERDDFLEGADAAQEEIVVLDIPLLYETKAESIVDAVLVVSAPAEIQRARVMARPGMTEETFEQLLEKQMPDAQKRERADYVIQSVDMDSTRAAVKSLIARIKSRIPNA